jgi:hypothetical protein
MSIIQSLKRLFDPVEYRQEQKELKRKAEKQELEGQPDLPPPKAEHRRCRLCGWEGEALYCLRCLAETMERVK